MTDRIPLTISHFVHNQKVLVIDKIIFDIDQIMNTVKHAQLTHLVAPTSPDVVKDLKMIHGELHELSKYFRHFRNQLNQ